MKTLQYILYTILVAYLSSCIREDRTPVDIPPIVGTTMEPNVGGPTQPNQVWIDLSDNQQTFTQRDAWDLAFYNGEEFRVLLNSSLMMAVGKVDGQYNIDEVNEAMVKDLKNLVQVGNFQPNIQYIDDASGNFLNQTTGISPIQKEDDQNPVFLLNMGKALYTGTTSPGAVAVAGDSRGWMKIRILRVGNKYKIQFAELNSNTHEEILIEKDSQYHFKFLNLKNKSLVKIHPEKKKWDLCFTVFTNSLGTGDNATSYTFSDMVLNNSLDAVAAYQVDTPEGQHEVAYNQFTKADVDESLFLANEQRAIGSSWRKTTGNNGPQVLSDRFYIVKDTEGFLYKLRFIKMVNSQGYRGYPEFEYQPL